MTFICSSTSRYFDSSYQLHWSVKSEALELLEWDLLQAGWARHDNNKLQCPLII